MLENCRSLGEVQLLLAEKSCAKRFFSQTKGPFMKDVRKMFRIFDPPLSTIWNNLQY